MALSGSIKEFGLTEVFELISHQKKEGRLILSRSEEKITVFFKEGKIIRAYKGSSEETFGENLLKANILTDDQVAIARYRQESKQKSFETTLVELGFVSPKELLRLSRLFTEEVIFNLFKWTSGEYRFEQEEIAQNPTLTHALDTQFLLMEAIRQIDEWPLLIKHIPSRKIIFKKTKTREGESIETKNSTAAREDSFESLEENESSEEGMDDRLFWLLEQLQGQKTVQEIINQAHLGAFLVYQGLDHLLSENKIKKVANKNSTQKRGSFLEDASFLRYAFNSTVILLVMGVFIFSYPSIQTVSVRAARSFQELKKLSKKNVGYFIRFALDLYYLKHNRYPAELNSLVEEGFFGTKMHFGDHLKSWSYELDSENPNKFILRQRSKLT